MSPIRTSRTLAVLLGCFAAAAGWFAFAGGNPGTAGPAPAAPQKAAAPAERQPDQDGVRKALDSFVAAFRKGDGKAVAAHWTAEGEYIDDEGTTYRGRAALEKAYAELFAKSPGNGLEVEVDSIRFPSRDNAVVEGHFKLRKPKSGELVVSRCSFLYAREDGKWLIAIAREWPGDGLSLRDLEWLIGTWEAKRDGTVVGTRYEWTANKSFIRCTFSVTRDGETSTGMQMIGKDPSTGLLKVWTFEDEGGIGETDITRDGKKWVHAARGVTAEGRVLTATNIMTPVDADSFLWHAVGRTLDDESLPDLPPIKVARVKGKP
jgi:uncharacterized protein (TIGR02246 family)